MLIQMCHVFFILFLYTMQLHIMFVDKTFKITIGFVSPGKLYIFDEMFTYIAFLNILFSE